jgi:hypothetical protein
MEEIEFEVQEHEKNLPEFQSGFTFVFKTNNDEKCYFEILDLENKVLQLSMMIHFKKSWFSSNMEQHFSILKDLCDENFQFHKEQEVGESKIYGWDGGEQMLSIRKLKSDIHQLSFVVGNRLLWDNLFKKEQEKKKSQQNNPPKKTGGRVRTLKFFCKKCDRERTHFLSKEENDSGRLIYKGHDIRSYINETITCDNCSEDHIVISDDRLESFTMKLKL